MSDELINTVVMGAASFAVLLAVLWFLNIIFKVIDWLTGETK